jgi:hypothetical protein
MILNNLDNPETNTLGLATTCLAALNSFFQLFNPVLTGIFYIASIGWLVVQIYYKTKGKK